MLASRGGRKRAHTATGSDGGGREGEERGYKERGPPDSGGPGRATRTATRAATGRATRITTRSATRKAMGRATRLTTRSASQTNAESARLRQGSVWKKWGPYLSERQWGTVREDHSEDNNCWEYFPHEDAVSRAYKWGEDGLFGVGDDGVNVCLSLALWNGKDPILKERLFGLTGPQGNHGEDVKELYYYLDSTPTHSYMRGLYKYPQAEFPYSELVKVNSRRTNTEPEYELLDTGVFASDAYWDVEVEYAKAFPGSLLCRYTVHNRGTEGATITVLPQLWYRNTWSWAQDSEAEIPIFVQESDTTVSGKHPEIGRLEVEFGKTSHGQLPKLLFTNNNTNSGRLQGKVPSRHAKDAFHRYIVHGEIDHVICGTAPTGTKVGALYTLTVPAGQLATVECILSEKWCSSKIKNILAFGQAFDDVIKQRREEADEFYKKILPAQLTDDERLVARQAYAGLLWSKQFYFYGVEDWSKAPERKSETKLNMQWRHLVNKDIISMPDKWEFPWYATWDLAFHMVPFAAIDLEFTKNQLLLLLSDRYMHPNGQLPAYEFNFSDVNPPVHAWACLHVYRVGKTQGIDDTTFLKKVFHRLLLNFNWWINQKSVEGSHLYSGGFLGMDNISAVERSHPPDGTIIKQVDGTGWMAFYSSCMLQMAVHLARLDEVYSDLAMRFLDHYLSIIKDMNGLNGLWDVTDAFYYDQIIVEGRPQVVRVRSLVGLLPLVAATILDNDQISELPDIKGKLAQVVGRGTQNGVTRATNGDAWLLSVVDSDRLRAILHRLLAESEFLSPFGIRSLSKVHTEPYSIKINGKNHSIHYCPGESESDMFGGNSNWRGPVWICMNYLLLEALRTYNHFLGSAFRVKFPTDGGQDLTLGEVAEHITRRITNIFLLDSAGNRPCHGGEARYAQDGHWKDLVLFSEYFHGDTGRGCGASHQTGWTALVTCLLQQLEDPSTAVKQLL